MSDAPPSPSDPAESVDDGSEPDRDGLLWCGCDPGEHSADEVEVLRCFNRQADTAEAGAADE